MNVEYCVIDTERIKGNQIYLFSYQLYDSGFSFIEGKTFQDVSIDLSNRKSPRVKVKELDATSQKVSSFGELYEVTKSIMSKSLLIVFSKTDVRIIQRNCKEMDIPYTSVTYLDLQEVLYELSTDSKHKSNLKQFCQSHHIQHHPHIPESDCAATFELFKYLIGRLGYDELFTHIRHL